MSTIVANRLSPSHVLYSTDLNWLQQPNGTNKSPSHPQKCKCKKIVEKKSEDCDSCNKHKEIKLERRLEDANTSSHEKSSDKQKIQMERPSSGKPHRKQLLSPSKPEDSPTSEKVLEKANSLTDSKPPKKLRTTKSLSPRPPIKHQHSVTVSDTNNIVSLKVSPAEDFDSVLNEHPRNTLIVSDSSPEGAIIGSLQLDDRHKNNRSTSCLVYVPMDPWTKIETTKTKKKGRSRMKKLTDVKSLSRPDLVDDDPWVFDESRKTKESKSATSQRRSHSKSSNFESKSGTARPRLQRSKSPAIVADENLKNPPSSPVNLSPQDPLSSLSPKLGYNSVRNDSNGNSKQKNQFLNVSNPNLLQPRHSFSAPKKDDELTLNIRRLSEQIKHSSNYASYGNFTSATVGSTSTSPKPGEMDKKSGSLLSDSLLETTC